MTIQTVASLSNSVRIQYEAQYQLAAAAKRVYDQLATSIAGDLSEDQIMRGSAVRIPFIAKLPVSEQVVSESQDIVPRTTHDWYLDVSPTSRADAIQWSEATDMKVYTDYGAARYRLIGEQMMQSVDLLALNAACQTPLQFFPGAHTSRATLDAGTSTDRASDAMFAKADAIFQSFHIPMLQSPLGGRGIAIMHPYAYHDLRLSGNIISVAQYQRGQIILNFELGEIGPFKLVVTPWAKTYWGAGADNGTAIATTVGTAVKALEKKIPVASGTNIAVGMRLNIGTEETADATYYPTNESVIVTSVDTNDINVVGGGENGGLMYDHAVGEAVRNADSVFPIIFGGPESLGKMYWSKTGEFGMIVGPKVTGLIDQFASLGWKWYGGYDRVQGNRVLKFEVASSLEA